MASETQSGSTSKGMLWTGLAISAVITLLLLLDAAMKIMQVAPVVQGTVQAGYPASAVLPIGIILLVCLICYAIPRTSVLGAILLTGYLGGAVASNLRISSPLLTYTLVPVYVGILVWAGLFLRDGRLRALIPFRKT
jgi:Na+/H+ antiporter NhaC